jgi:hypothetical protein
MQAVEFRQLHRLDQIAAYLSGSADRSISSAWAASPLVQVACMIRSGRVFGRGGFATGSISASGKGIGAQWVNGCSPGR